MLLSAVLKPVLKDRGGLGIFFEIFLYFCGFCNFTFFGRVAGFFYFILYYLFRHHNAQVNGSSLLFGVGLKPLSATMSTRLKKSQQRKDSEVCLFFSLSFLIYFFFSNKFSTLEDVVNFFCITIIFLLLLLLLADSSPSSLCLSLICH